MKECAKRIYAALSNVTILAQEIVRQQIMRCRDVQRIHA